MGSPSQPVTAGRAALLELARLSRPAPASPSEVIHELTRAVGTAIGVERCSVWLLAEADKELRCLDLFELTKGAHSAGPALRASNYPRYFQALARGLPIDAPDAQADPRTSEFCEGYLAPLSITSMLDAAVQRKGRVVGVVCCEHVGPPRRWSREEVLLAKAFADQAALILAADERRRLEEERERILRQLEASEDRYRRLMESANDAICIADPDGKIVEVNRRSEELLGTSRDRIVGRHFGEFVVAEDRAAAAERFARQLSGEPVESLRLRLLRPGGSPLQVDISASFVDVGTTRQSIAVLRDVTEREQAEARQRHSQKMEALGRLAGGVAHDFNNMLAVIALNAEMMIDTLYEEDPNRESVAEMLGAAHRAEGLTRQLLAFSRRQVLEPSRLDLNGVARDLTAMIRRLIGEDIMLRADLRASISVEADRGGVEQVLLNLVVNARDAMPRGGTLTIETADAPDRRGAVLTVTDTGDGMDAATLSRIFEPFFSTKGLGRGTGLGLSTVYGIVQQSRATINVESELESGSRFTVVFPVATTPSSTESIAPRSERSMGGSETLLLVEDDDLLRRVLRRGLCRAGYRVLEATSGADAIALWERNPGAIDLVLTDVVMPGMSGPELVTSLRADTTWTKVLYMSGYLDDAMERHGVRPARDNLVEKPFTLPVVTRKIRQLLDGEVNPPSSSLQ